MWSLKPHFESTRVVSAWQYQHSCSQLRLAQLSSRSCAQLSDKCVTAKPCHAVVCQAAQRQQPCCDPTCCAVDPRLLLLTSTRCVMGFLNHVTGLWEYCFKCSSRLSVCSTNLWQHIGGDEEDSGAIKGTASSLLLVCCLLKVDC